jgi:acyl carrier protein
VQTDMEKEVAALIVEGLNLEIPPEEIDPLAPLFGDGLSLDSIDALEVALLVSKTFGVTIAQGDSKNHEIFASLQALSDFVAAHRKH